MTPKGPDDSWLPSWIKVENAKREELRAQHRVLFDEVSAILFDVDPIGINFETNTDEYDAEAGTILPRLETCTSVESVRSVIHQEFVRWFGPEEAGEEARYEQAAHRVWQAWVRLRNTE